jgi:hypothetical protein
MRIYPLLDGIEEIPCALQGASSLGLGDYIRRIVCRMSKRQLTGQHLA